MPHQIEVRDLHKSVQTGLWSHRHLLRGVSFSVARGVVCGLVGHNGAGKTTTIKQLIGVQRPTSGTVRIAGLDPRTTGARRHLGYAAEQPLLPPTLTPFEILSVHQKLSHRSGDVGFLLERVGLSADGHRLIRGFSKGMCQRLALAISLVGKPETLILDEPMSGLDPEGRALVRDLIAQESSDGVTVLFSSHNLADVALLCSQVVALRQGKVVFDETRAEARNAGWVVECGSPIPAGLLPPPFQHLGPMVAAGPPEVDVWRAAAKLQDHGIAVLKVAHGDSDLERRLLPLLRAEAVDG